MIPQTKTPSQYRFDVGGEQIRALSLPRVLWLGEDKTLRMAPPGELAHLRYNPRGIGGLTAPANAELPLNDISGYHRVELGDERRYGGTVRRQGVLLARR